MDDPSLHHLDLQKDVPFDNYDSDEKPLAVVQRTLLDSREESSRNASITEAKLRLTTLLASNGIWPVSADGDCLLSAVIAQVPELNHDTTALRQCLCEHIIANVEHYSPFLQGGPCALLAQIELLKKKGQWNSDLGDLVPFAIANFLQRNILIFSIEETSPITTVSPTLTRVQGKDLAIVRLAVPGFEHYDAIKELPLTTQPLSTFCSSNTRQSPRHQAKYTSPKKRETVRKRERHEGSWNKECKEKITFERQGIHRFQGQYSRQQKSSQRRLQ